jgi:predicted nucleotidyltransferase
MRAREGDLIKTVSNVVFDVKGLLHPNDKVIAFPRFIPSPQGTRKGNGATYGKVYSLDERFKYLQKNHPDLIVFDPVFGETLCEVPIEQIAELYQPTEKLSQLRKAEQRSPLESKALQLASTQWFMALKTAAKHTKRYRNCVENLILASNHTPKPSSKRFSISASKTPK